MLTFAFPLTFIYMFYSNQQHSLHRKFTFTIMESPLTSSYVDDLYKATPISTTPSLDMLMGLHKANLGSHLIPLLTCQHLSLGVL